MPTKSSTKKQNLRPAKPKARGKLPEFYFSPPVFGRVRPTERVDLPPGKGAEERFHRCDYVGEILSATSATNGALYIVGAQNSTLFPILSAYTQTWLKYRFRRLRLHLMPKSSTTQKGNLVLGAVAADAGFGGAVSPSTAAAVRSLTHAKPFPAFPVQDAASDALYFDFPVEEGSINWYSVDTDAGANLIGTHMGRIFQSLPATVAAGDIQFDVYAEFDVEFCGRVTVGTVNYSFEERRSLEKALSLLEEEDKAELLRYAQKLAKRNQSSLTV